MNVTDPHERPNPKRCGAKTRSGKHCRRAGTGAGGRCNLHGGKTPVGLASPNWKHGLRSRYNGLNVPHYEEALNDPQLMQLTEDAALVELMVRQLHERAVRTGKLNTTQRKELERWVDLRQRIISAEARKLRDLSLAIPVERVKAMGAALVQATRNTLLLMAKDGRLTVDGEDAIREVNVTWQRLMGRLPMAHLGVVDDDAS